MLRHTMLEFKHVIVRHSHTLLPAPFAAFQASRSSCPMQHGMTGV